MGLLQKKTRKFAVHAGGGAENGGEKRNVLIVSVLLPIATDLALRSNMQRRVHVLWACQVGPSTETNQSCALLVALLSCARACVVGVKIHRVFFAAAQVKLVLLRKTRAGVVLPHWQGLELGPVAHGRK